MDAIKCSFHDENRKLLAKMFENGELYAEDEPVLE